MYEGVKIWNVGPKSPRPCGSKVPAKKPHIWCRLQIAFGKKHMLRPVTEAMKLGSQSRKWTTKKPGLRGSWCQSAAVSFRGSAAMGSAVMGPAVAERALPSTHKPPTGVRRRDASSLGKGAYLHDNVQGVRSPPGFSPWNPMPAYQRDAHMLW